MTSPVGIALAVVVAVLGSLIVAVVGWVEARRGERHAVVRAVAAERAMLRAEVRAGKIEVATEAIKQAATVIREHEMARYIPGWDGLARACRLYDRTVDDLDADETNANPARL